MKVYLSSTSIATMLSVVIFLSGCGSSEPEKVVGTVTVNVVHEGKPVTEGSVNMVVIGSAKSANGKLNDAGTVILENVEVGNYTVSIMPPPIPDADPTKPAVPMKKYPNIPKKFRSETTSPLKAEVKQGDNKFEFDLK